MATLASPAQAKAGLKKFEPDCDAETVTDLFSEQDLGSGSLMTILVYNLSKHLGLFPWRIVIRGPDPGCPIFRSSSHKAGPHV